MNKEQVDILIGEYMKKVYALCCIHVTCKSLKEIGKKKVAIDDILKITNQVVAEEEVKDGN